MLGINTFLFYCICYWKQAAIVHLEYKNVYHLKLRIVHLGYWDFLLKDCRLAEYIYFSEIVIFCLNVLSVVLGFQFVFVDCL